MLTNIDVFASVPEEKADLQKKLSFILLALAATYEDIGYCQGMDYVVAHLLRNLENTIRAKAAKKEMPAILSTTSALAVSDDLVLLNKDIDAKNVIEETVVRDGYILCQLQFETYVLVRTSVPQDVLPSL